VRADAVHHRELLVTTAARVFAKSGYDASLQLVIDESGLGRGTLYRHFPDRGALLVAVLERQIATLEHFVSERIGKPDLFCLYLREQAIIGAHYQPSRQFLDTEIPAAQRRRLRSKGEKLAVPIVASAKRNGYVGDSFSESDLAFIGRMLMNVAADPKVSGQRDAIGRAIDIVLDGIRPRSG
jgi:AcrR family transcriptional regulator